MAPNFEDGLTASSLAWSCTDGKQNSSSIDCQGTAGRIISMEGWQFLMCRFLRSLEHCVQQVISGWLSHVTYLLENLASHCGQGYDLDTALGWSECLVRN